MLAERVSQLLRGVQARPSMRPTPTVPHTGTTPAAAKSQGPDFGTQLLQLAKAQQEALQQGDMPQFRALAAQRAQMTAKLHQTLNTSSPAIDPKLQAELQRLDQVTRQILVRRYAAAQPAATRPQSRTV